jgi:hypothetical protein
MSRFNDEHNIKKIKNHIMKLSKALQINCPVVYVAEQLDWYIREQLIKNDISFVVLDQQIYLPFLGKVLSSKYGPIGIDREKFSPAAQYIFIEIISSDRNTFQLYDFLKFGISRSSISRALNELLKFAIINKRKSGVDVFWEVEKPKQRLWKENQHYLFNPVIKTTYVKRDFNYIDDLSFVLSGVNALSRVSMLSESEVQEYAICHKNYNDQNYETTSKNDDKAIKLQLWKHEVPLYHGNIHPLALLLSYIGNDDARIEDSLDTAINSFWEVRE